ncbi:MAG: PVC-type heme-binding CxxCH protein [Planctomycetaceae bacterium]
MNVFRASLCGGAICVWIIGSLAAQDPFAAGVRPTDPLSPQDEQKALQVPNGFEVQLVAAEPDIFKPMNMAFDERGRMWITDSLEYPWAAPLDKPARDSVKILHDTDGDGKADVIKTFADGLNIPIGIYPYPSRKDEKTGKTIQGAIVYSIPFIWDLRDTDGDDICDERIKLYGPFGYERDTHGMCNAFRRGFDGWIYACHGFNNISKVAGKDGHVVEMSSGNTFRFRMDGSRIEHFTHGQVNPFGMCFDPLFNIFTADCHTKPITQLLRGGYYQSFGKPHDGLGFVPEIMSHTHGTTANCGIVAYYGGHFPKEWEGMFFTGNVMTSRVNVDAPEYHGSTILAKERPDFVISKDPWFRPVDLQCGPDGALYILDFYNKIIGHYEVDLKHPGRDRHRGRVWKVIHKATPLHKMPDLRTQTPEQLVELLAHDNLTVRLLATQRLCDSLSDVARNSAVAACSTMFAENTKVFGCCHSWWVLARLGSLTPQLSDLGVENPRHAEVRVHALKSWANHEDGDAEFRDEQVRKVLGHPNAFVQRAAADALGKAPSAINLAALLTTHEKISADDSHLRQVVRMAVRECLAAPGQFEAQGNSPLDEEFSRQLTDFALAIRTAEAAGFVIRHLQKHDEPAEKLLPMVQHAARYADTNVAKLLVGIVRKRFADDVQQQLGLLSTLRVALQQRGESPDASLRDWATDVSRQLLESSHGASLSWANEVVPGKPKPDNPWELRARVSQDGDKGSLFLDSLVKGEQLTGLYRSEPFELPAKLSFWCAGHNGVPGAPFNPKNFIRLRDASTHALLREAMPPRNDTAQRIEWDLAEFRSTGGSPVSSDKDQQDKDKQDRRAARATRGYIELLDADDGSGFAWLAVGRFSLEALNPSRAVEQQIAAANLISDFKISNLKSQISERLTSRDTDARAKEAFARAVLTLEPDSILLALAPLISEVSMPESLRDAIAAAVVDRRLASLKVTKVEGRGTSDIPLLTVIVQAVPERLQLRLAESLASDATGAAALLSLAKDGNVSPRLLTRPTVKLRLEALKSEAFAKQITELTANLPDDNVALQKLIEQRRSLFLAAQSDAEPSKRPSLEAGAALFTKHCAVCHQVAGKGTIVGPQLDGIGQRGLERVLEDVLDPNRNVDVNFRMTTVVTKAGKIVSGLTRREEGATLVLVDNKGKEFTVPLAEIDERTKSSLSLMPANVAEILTEREFLDLVSYLLSQRQKAEPK